MTTVHPDVATLLEVAAASPIAWDADTDVDAARGGWRLLLTAGTGCAAIDHVEDRVASGGAHDVPVRIYRPEEAEGVLVWFHGGGFVLGDLDSHDGLMRVLARRFGGAVVSVDYRLAPEHRFPAAQEDALVAWEWAVSQASELAGGTATPAVGGDSAGGSLAAHVAIEARNGPRAPSAVVLACPLTDFSDTAASEDPSPSMREKADGYLLTADALAWFADHFVPQVGERRDPRVSVLYAPDLAGVARTLVITAEHDPLRDQGEAFAARLAASGVEVTCSRYDRTVHAFFGLVELLESGRRCLDEAVAFLRERH